MAPMSGEEKGQARHGGLPAHRRTWRGQDAMGGGVLLYQRASESMGQNRVACSARMHSCSACVGVQQGSSYNGIVCWQHAHGLSRSCWTRSGG
jgi:hypothetical protein